MEAVWRRPHHTLPPTATIRTDDGAGVRMRTGGLHRVLRALPVEARLQRGALVHVNSAGETAQILCICFFPRFYSNA